MRERVGFDRAHANELEIRDGRLTGRLLGPIVGPAAKLDHLHALALEVGRAAILAVGDGANDRPMIEAAGLGAAFRAKPVLEAAADIVVRHTGLDSLLYVQGYADDGMVDGS